MKPRSPLTAIEKEKLQSILGITLGYLNKLIVKGLPNYTRNGASYFNLYDVLGFYKNLIASAKRPCTKSLLQQNVTKIESYISSFKSSLHTTMSTTTTKAPAPFKHYPADRRFLTGDNVWIAPFCGRTNGIAQEYLNRLAIVTKDEDNFGCVTLRMEGNAPDQVQQIPSCNCTLIRAVEDIPVLAIMADTSGFYITHKGVQEAVAAFWYGGKTGRMKEDARALAEMTLELLKQEPK